MSPQLTKTLEAIGFAALAAGGGVVADALAQGKFDNHVWAPAGAAALAAIVAYLRQPPREDWHAGTPSPSPDPPK